MATAQGMSGMDVTAMTAELRDLLPLWIGKIYQYEGKTLAIRLNGEEHAKYNLLVEAGRRANLVPDIPTPPKTPPGFAMLLRKYLLGGRVKDIRQVGMQRVFSISVQKKEAVYHLFFELFDEGNAVLCGEDLTIIKPLWHHRFKDREVIPGEKYAISGRDCARQSDAEMAALLKQSGRDLVRTLAVDCMLGGQYAEEVARRAEVEKNAPAAEANPEAVYRAITGLLNEVEHDRSPVIMESGCWPVQIGGGHVLQTFATFNQALAAFYPTLREEIKKPEAQRLTKQEVIRRQQEGAIAKFDQRIERLEKTIALVYENYGFVDETIRALRSASENHSWQEIEKTLKRSDSPLARKVVAVHPAEAAVTLDIGVQVKIPVNQSIEETVSSFYDQIKKFRGKKEGALAAMEKAPRERAAPERRPAIKAAKPRWFQRFRWFYTSDGTLVLGGKDADQNEELVKKYMEGGDTFVHADVHGASVVLVKGTTERMDEVAQFAASYSGAWRSGHFSADVYTARPDQVSKTPPSGEYVSRGSFIVRGERTYYRDVPLSTAVGVQLVPEATVIGGPPEAVKKHARAYVTLIPGQYEPNDIARKVVRVLRQAFSPEESKDLKNILSTERVAAFVPPGGSDIVEQHEG